MDPGSLIHARAIDRVAEDYPEKYFLLAVHHRQIYGEIWTAEEITAYFEIWKQSVKDWELFLTNQTTNNEKSNTGKNP